MPRKALALSAILAVTALAAAADEMSLDQVLAKHYEAIGGLDAWKGIHSLIMKGKMQVPSQGFEAPISLTIKRPQNIRIEFTVQGMTGIQAFDGETAWQVMPFMGSTDPQPLPEEQVRDLREQADLDGMLVDYASKGHQVLLLGTEEVEGTETYKLEVTLKDGEKRWVYLDSEYFLPIRIDAKTTRQGTELDIETSLGDYKEAGGLMLPHYIESRPKGEAVGQQITIESVQTNVEVPDSAFAMPAIEKPAMEDEG